MRSVCLLLIVNIGKVHSLPAVSWRGRFNGPTEALISRQLGTAADGQSGRYRGRPIIVGTLTASRHLCLCWCGITHSLARSRPSAIVALRCANGPLAKF